MSGYYPATYGFEDTKDDANPFNWEVGEKGGTVNVIASEEDHHKIVELHDTTASSTYFVYFTTNFTDQSEGTIEWWWKTSDVSNLNRFRLRRGSNDAYAISFQIDDDKFQYYDGATLTDIIGITPLDNTWYHVNLDFNCNTDQFDVYIDGILRLDDGNFSFTADTLFSVQFQTSKDDYNYYQYVDAVGFSWDPNYNIGDNLDEGLLLSYDTNIDFNWFGYSLDGQPNKTIIGNTTISMPEDGIHKIQVLGNASSGVIYESEFRYFTTGIPDIPDINAPEITIHAPVDSETYGINPPDFNISVSGEYETLWYTIDGGLTNITIIDLTGIINQAEWDNKSDGIITITFYANNSESLIGSASVQIIKNVSDGNADGGQQIPSYNLFILISIFGFISIIIFRKRILK